MWGCDTGGGGGWGTQGTLSPKEPAPGGGRCQGPARLLRAPGEFIPRAGPPPALAGSLKLWGGHRDGDSTGAAGHTATRTDGPMAAVPARGRRSRAAGPPVPDGDEETTGGQAAGATLPAVLGRTFLDGCSWGRRGERTGASVPPPCLPSFILCPLLRHCPLTHDTPWFHGQQP